MTELWRLARLIRSKNAGPFELTFDIMFDDEAGFDRLLAADLITKDLVADLYGTPVEDIGIFVHRQALAVKISIPRPFPSGHQRDTDLFGGQFHSPLVTLDIPEVMP